VSRTVVSHPVLSPYPIVGSYLRLTLHEARELRAADLNGRHLKKRTPLDLIDFTDSLTRASFCTGLSDPFVLIRSGKITLYRSDIKRATIQPVWEEAVDIPIDEKLLSRQELSLHVFDYDLIGRNSPLGYCAFDVRDLKSQWVFSDWVPLKDTTSGSLRVTILYMEPMKCEQNLPIPLENTPGRPTMGKHEGKRRLSMN
jgi:hypothetical protein